MKTNIWNPASRILDFYAIESSLKCRGVLHTFGFDDNYREISFPVDKNFLFGEIVLIEFYSEHVGYYFFYWRNPITEEIENMPESFIYKINAKTGKIVQEGAGLTTFKAQLTDKFFEYKGIPKKNFDYIREELPVFFERLLSVIDFEVKNTIRSNMEAFLDSIV